MSWSRVPKYPGPRKPAENLGWSRWSGCPRCSSTRHGNARTRTHVHMCGVRGVLHVNTFTWTTWTTWTKPSPQPLPAVQGRAKYPGPPGPPGPRATQPRPRRGRRHDPGRVAGIAADFCRSGLHRPRPGAMRRHGSPHRQRPPRRPLVGRSRALGSARGLARAGGRLRQPMRRDATRGHAGRAEAADRAAGAHAASRVASRSVAPASPASRARRWWRPWWCA